MLNIAGLSMVMVNMSVCSVLHLSGEKGHLFQGNSQILRVTGTISKTYFRFLRNRGTSQFISGEQGNRYPSGRASIMIIKNGKF